MKIACIRNELQPTYTVRDCCRVLAVSSSGYYRWKTATASARSLRRSSLTTEVRGEHERSRGVYGSPRIHAQLCKRQIHVNVKTVAHIMNDANIRAKTVKNGIHAQRKAITRLRLRPMSLIATSPRVAPTRSGCATSLVSQPSKDFYISLA